MFNKFYNYITGLINNRFVYQGGPEAPKPTEADEASQEAKELTDEQSATKKAYEDYAGIAKSGEKAAEKATELKPQGPIDYSKQDKYRDVEHGIDTIAGKLRPRRAPGEEVQEEALAEPKDEILDKAKKLAADEQVNAELAKLGIMPKEEKPAPEYTPAEELAIASNTVEQAGVANEFAYIAQQMENPTENQIRDWVSYAKSLGDKLSVPGADIDSVVLDMQNSMPERDMANIGYMGEVAKSLIDKGEEVNAKSLVNALKGYAGGDDVRKKLNTQFSFYST